MSLAAVSLKKKKRCNKTRAKNEHQIRVRSKKFIDGCLYIRKRGGQAVSFFFFQAEDGIRGFHVTGVQTYALPISTRALTFLMVVGPGLIVMEADNDAGA